MNSHQNKKKEANKMTLKEFEANINRLFNEAIASIDDIWKDYNNITKTGK